MAYQEEFPVLYEDGNCIIYKNSSGEIFVEPKTSKSATIRISCDSRQTTVTCAGGILTPTSINGLSAFRATTSGR